MTSYAGNYHAYGSQPRAVTVAFGNRSAERTSKPDQSHALNGATSTFIDDDEKRLTAISGGPALPIKAIAHQVMQ